MSIFNDRYGDQTGIQYTRLEQHPLYQLHHHGKAKRRAEALMTIVEGLAFVFFLACAMFLFLVVLG